MVRFLFLISASIAAKRSPSLLGLRLPGDESTLSSSVPRIPIQLLSRPVSAADNRPSAPKRHPPALQKIGRSLSEGRLTLQRPMHPHWRLRDNGPIRPSSSSSSTAPASAPPIARLSLSQGIIPRRGSASEAWLARHPASTQTSAKPPKLDAEGLLRIFSELTKESQYAFLEAVEKQQKPPTPADVGEQYVRDLVQARQLPIERRALDTGKNLLTPLEADRLAANFFRANEEDRETFLDAVQGIFLRRYLPFPGHPPESRRSSPIPAPQRPARRTLKRGSTTDSVGKSRRDSYVPDFDSYDSYDSE